MARSKTGRYVAGLVHTLEGNQVVYPRKQGDAPWIFEAIIAYSEIV